MNSNATELEQVLPTHILLTSCRSSWPRGVCFSVSIPILTPENLLPCQWVSVPFSTYSLPPPDRMPDHASTKCGTEPIRYMTLHFPAASRSFAPPLLKSHRKTFTVPMCQQKSCPVWFSREVPAPELSGIVRTGPKENFVLYQKKPKVIRWSWCLCWKILRPNHCFKFCFKKPS